jgi:HEAT repeat protein
MLFWERGRTFTVEGWTMRTSIMILFAMFAIFLTAGHVFAQATDGSELKKAGDIVEGKTLLQWQNDLKSKDPSEREAAIHFLKAYGRNARVAVRDVIKAMGDRDASLRANAAITLGFIGMEREDREAGVSALIRLLGDSQGIVKYQAATALGRLGPDASSAIPALVSTIRDRSSYGTSWETQRASASALGKVGLSESGIDPRAFGALLNTLRDPCVEVRLECLHSLINLGTPGNKTDLDTEKQWATALSNDKQSKKVSIWARVLAMRIDKVSEVHLSFIGKLMRDNDLQVRINAAKALAYIGREAKSQVAELIAGLGDKEPQVIAWCCVALGYMGSGAKEAVPTLQGLLNHPDEVVRRAAKEALDKILEKIQATK